VSSELAIIIAVIPVVLIIAGLFMARRGGAQPPSTPAQAMAPPVGAPTTAEPGSPLVAELNDLQKRGQWDAISRRLDAILPEWPVSSSLIEVARALGNLDHDLGLLPREPVTGVVVTRLQGQTNDVAQHLWRLADQLVLAERMRTPTLQQRLQQEDEILVRLLPAIQNAQTELVDLTLGGDISLALRRAEGRFLALGDTARELQSLSG
jgi:hypothetical protein